METIETLRWIENEEKYAMASELAYLHAFNAIMVLENNMNRESRTLQLHDCHDPFQNRCRELIHILNTMGKVLRDMADRRKWLVDVAAGLPNVVFDEETPQS